MRARWLLCLLLDHDMRPTSLRVEHHFHGRPFWTTVFARRCRRCGKLVR